MQKAFFFLITSLLPFGQVMAQQYPLTLLPSGKNKPASVSEQVGLAEVTIRYSRPGVRGRDGQIWGKLIPVGFTDQGITSTTKAPWRAGANENTTIEFSRDVLIEGQPLAAGKYGFFVAYGPDQCTLIFSKNATSWGAFFYQESEDALRVNVKPQPVNEKVEWLKYEFLGETDSTAVVALEWEKLMIPFTVQTHYVRDQLDLMRNQLRSDHGFVWQSWDQAAAWCLTYNTDLDEALQWTDTATSVNFGGSQSFTAWSTRAMVLGRLGRSEDSAAAIRKALVWATMVEMHVFARQLITLKQPTVALEMFKENYQRYPGQFMTLVGLARGYGATGQYALALKYAMQAQPLIPNEPNRVGLEHIIERLKSGQDPN